MYHVIIFQVIKQYYYVLNDVLNQNIKDS